MDALDREGKRPRTVVRAVEAQAGNLRQRGGGRADERDLMLADGRQADAVYEVQRSGQGDGTLNIRSAGLELEGQIVVCGFLKCDFLDHLAAAAPWGHAVEDFLPAPEDADAGRGVDLVTGKSEEIDAERLHVDAAMAGGLGSVDHHQRARLSGGGGHFRDGIDGAEGVRNPSQRKQFHRAFQEGEEGGLIKRPVFEAGDDLEDGAGPFAEHLPGDDIRVVFEGGDEDFIAGLDAAGKREALGDQVDGIGGAGGEDDLDGTGRIQVRGDGAPGIFERLGG